ncbi:MAG TPA: hypothetical protein VMT76_04535 [Puia sp.]|nr:hypothetical protein [Puia sp.]
MLRTFFLPIFICISSFLYSQESTSTQLQASKAAVTFYRKYIDENIGLNNGSEYVAYDFRIKGHPYFESGTLQKGNVMYCGTLYDEIDMAYDIVEDALIILKNDDNVRIRLAKEKIDSFLWLDHFFVRLVQDSNNKTSVPTGFYDRLYNGQIKLYARRKKIIMEKIEGNENERWFQENDAYIIHKDKSYYPVQKESDLFNLLNDKKKEIKKYLRKNKIKFRKEKETAILAAIVYYDKLKD